MRCFKGVAGAWLLALGLALPAAAVTPGQIDTFEDGTTQNWIAGALGAPHPAPPVNVPTGGPAGANDNYLLLTAVGGMGPGSRLTAQNFDQWAGDYLAAGVNSIAMDVRNLGSTDLTLRLSILNPTMGPPTDLAVSESWLLPAGGGWKHLIFSLAPADLTAVLGDSATALATATELRILHNPVADFPGPPIVAQLGVDNIEAPAVPEPTSLALLGLAGSALPLRRRLQRRAKGVG